jgi:hypothetical protein
MIVRHCVYTARGNGLISEVTAFLLMAKFTYSYSYKYCISLFREISLRKCGGKKSQQDIIRIHSKPLQDKYCTCT